MGQLYTAFTIGLRSIEYMSGRTNPANVVSGGDRASFIKPANQADIDREHDRMILSVNDDPNLLASLGLTAQYLFTFWGAAQTHIKGFERTKLVGVADPETYERFLKSQIEITPENAWFNDRHHAIVVAAALSQLRDSI